MAVDAVLGAQFRAGDLARGIDAARRQNLHEGDELPGRQFGADLGFFGDRDRGHGLRLGLGLFHGDRQFLLERLEGAGFRADQLDVLRRGAAAAADDLDAGPEQAARVLRHVLGRAQINVAAFHAHGQTGVGHRAQRLGGVLHHALDGFERGLGADRAIEADGIHRPGVHLAGEGLGVGAAGQVAEIVDGHLRDHRHVAAGGFVRGHHGLAQFIEVAESLEDQQIDAGFEQRIDLFAEDGARFGEGGGAERFDAHVRAVPRRRRR